MNYDIFQIDTLQFQYYLQSIWATIKNLAGESKNHESA